MNFKKQWEGVGDLFIKVLHIVMLLIVNLVHSSTLKSLKRFAIKGNDYKVVSIQISTNAVKD